MMLERARDRRGRSLSAALVSMLALSATLALGTASSGCSFKLIRPAPPRSTWPDPVVPSSSEQRCTDSIGIPVLDTIVAGSVGTLTYIERHAGSRDITIALGVATVPLVVSAIYGYVQTSRCERYKKLFEQAADAPGLGGPPAAP